MNIRAASITINENILSIKTKTSFAKKGIENSDNINLMIKSLEDM
jgi:hypothetical protein